MDRCGAASQAKQARIAECRGGMPAIGFADCIGMQREGIFSRMHAGTIRFRPPAFGGWMHDKGALPAVRTLKQALLRALVFLCRMGKGKPHELIRLAGCSCRQLEDDFTFTGVAKWE